MRSTGTEALSRDTVRPTVKASVPVSSGPQSKQPSLGHHAASLHCPTSWGLGARGVGVRRAGVSRGLCPARADAVPSPGPHTMVTLCVSVTSNPLPIRVPITLDQGPP